MLAYLNLENIKVKQEFEIFLIVFLNRTLLVPIMTLWFFVFYKKLPKKGHRLMILLLYTFSLSLFEYIGDWVGFIHHKDWNLWWTILEWIGIFIVLIGFSQYVKKLIRIEVEV